MAKQSIIDKKELIKTVQAILTALLIVSIIYVFWYQHDSRQSDKKLEEIAETTANTDSSQSKQNQKKIKDSFVQKMDSVKKNEPKKEILDEYLSLFNANKDLVGWLSISDTKLSVPVVQGNNNEYYLDRDFYREKDKRGTVFVDCNADITDNPSNTLIYGHYVSDKSMFGALEGYKDEDFLKSHPIIEFNSLYEKRSYEVISVFLSKVYDDSENVFKYYDFNNISSEDEFNSYLLNILKMSLVDTQGNAVYGDELITLSTCDYYTADGRLVVVAKRVNK